MKSLLLIPLILAGCAETIIYRDGKMIAKFQGDMTHVNYSDAEIYLTADSINHSAATLAQGEAANSKIQATGVAIATAGITSLIK